MSKKLEDMSIDELKRELELLKECLREEEEMFDYIVNKSTIHLGVRDVAVIRDDVEGKKRDYQRRIIEIEEILKKKGVEGPFSE